jgi:amino acid transporter
LSNGRAGLARVLGRFDLTLFLIAALVNLNSVPVVAGIGPAALLFWALGFFLFFVPATVAVLELSHRDPEEGGIYRWTKTAFGDFHGFLSGWAYWTNNIFYVPTLLLYMIAFATFIGGESTAGIGDNRAVVVPLALVLLWVITALNILGLGVSKWIQNIGALGTFLTAALIFGIGLGSMKLHGMANEISFGAVTAQLGDWRTLALLSVVCLNYVGVELGSIIGDELKHPRRDIPQAALVAGLATFVLYFMTTFSLQAAIPAGEIGVIDGILQGVKHVVTELDLAWLLPPIALLMTFNAAGNTSAWLSGSARIPFVVGLDRYLPAALGRVHPSYRTPHVALIVQGIASSAFILVNSVGASVQEVYMILLQTTIILQLIPYLYMFGSLAAIRRRAEREGGEAGYFRSAALCYLAAVVGGLMTLAGILFAFLPPAGVEDVLGFEMKTMLGSLGLMLPALLIFRWRSRRVRAGAILPEPVELAE